MLKLRAALLFGAFAIQSGAAQRHLVAPTSIQIQAGAMEVMKAARYATLATIGKDGQPQSRIVDPLVSPDGTIWIGTNPLTRKVGEIRKDSRVSLLFFNAKASEYVTVIGNASIVNDVRTKSAHWKEDWAPFYKSKHAGSDFMLIRVQPSRLEVSSQRLGLNNHPVTWRPVTIDLR